MTESQAYNDELSIGKQLFVWMANHWIKLIMLTCNLLFQNNSNAK